MSEENSDQATEIVDSGEGSGSVNITDDSALQSRMNGDNGGYWYDEGYGSYINPTTGEPIHDTNGGKVPEGALQEYLKTQNATKQSVEKSGQPVQQKQAIETDFNNDINGKVNPIVSKALSYSYTPSFMKSAVQPVQPAQQAIEQPKDFRTEFKEYSATVKTAYLAPYEKAIKAMQASDVYNSNNPAAVELAEEYKTQCDLVEDHLNDKLFELREKSLSSKDSSKNEEAAFKVIQQEANQVFGKVAAENGGVDVLEKLLFGQNVAGKDVKGPGTDAVLMLFDLTHEGKEVKDFNAELKKWWPTIARNEGALRTLTMLAHAVNTVKNQQSDRAEVRKKTLAEVAQQKRFIKPNPSGTQFGDNGQSSRDAALARYSGMDIL